MPRLRSQTKSEDTTTGGGLKGKMKKKIVEEQTQWVMVAPRSIMEKPEKVKTDEVDVEGTLCQLPHPQNGVPNLFLFKGNHVYQLIRCEEQKYRSWFIDSTVQKDGSIYFITAVDPLFLVLPYLVKNSGSEKFVPLDHLLVDDRFPLGVQMLERCMEQRSLMNLCECRGSNDFHAYKANEEKILAWIVLKIRRLSAHLKSSQLPVDVSSARVKSFVRNVEKTGEDCLKYAWMMVSDYLSPTWSQRVKQKLNITDVVLAKPATPTVAAKKQKLGTETENGGGVVEDYRSEVKEPLKKKVKLSIAQKKLDKVDKKGMKSMSSFFTAKPKK